MGSLFSSPAPPPAPVYEPGPDPEVEARKQRLAEMERRRRGRNGLIATGERGLLSAAESGAGVTRKTLLGE
ncbi:hypothetical protein [Roseospirillum parvum]|uniref:Uncharacterized protein n=1 Tax=Roseospirillum parvum TaxID=83401 RepID=A0A1G7W7J6_9PROT|nr:hypothetical protein [Roseospirillum parvum]SDG67883.1 hypothetical protein SAMN05421742_102103 [Roseospirillum parvum]